MSTSPDVSIVVLNWNTSDLLQGALQSVVETAGNLTIDVVVIDNASTDGGFERLDNAFAHDPRFSFIQNEKNIGWAAINGMLKQTRGKYILTLDPDALLHSGALQSLWEFMESHPKAGAVTAKLLNGDGSPQLYYRRIMTPQQFFFTTLLGRAIDKYLLGLREFRYYRYSDLDLNSVSEVEQPAWPCLMWRREALGDYIVDEDIPFYFVDVDMSKRLYDRGYVIYLNPAATITHLKSKSFAKRDDVWRRREYNRSLVVYFRKHYPLSLPLLWSMLWCDRVLRMLVRNIFGREPLQ